jgi:hypothetical protein
MKAHPHPVSPAAVLPACVFAAALAAAAGCASIVREPVVEVHATRNAMAPERDQKSYVITCKNDLVQQWLLADRKALLALDAALETLGYEEAADANRPTHVIEAELGFAPRPTLENAPNPDSVRFQNVAAMIGQGRYSQILTERNDSSGSLLMGPDGQIIPTGGWKQVMDDSQPRETKAPAGSHDTLILRAWDIVEGDGAKIPVWEVMVTRTVEFGRLPSPEHVGIMLRHAAERLEEGWSTTAEERGGALRAADPPPEPARPPSPAPGKQD